MSLNLIPSLRHCATIGLIALLSACGGDTKVPFSTSPDSDQESNTPTKDFLLASEGLTLRLFDTAGGTLDELTSATATEEEESAGLSIFGIVKHPTQPWAYTMTIQGYSQSSARIDRFTVSDSGLAFAGTVYDYDDAMDADCAGSCTPVDGTFSADGTRLYIQEDTNDIVQIFAVNTSTGALTWIGEGGNPRLHGMAMHPTKPFIYNGTNILAVNADVVNDIAENEGGNDTRIRTTATGLRLFSTLSTYMLTVQDIANDTTFSEVATLEKSGNQIRSYDVNAAGNLFIIAGQNSLETLTLGEGSFTSVQAIDYSEETESVENRRVVFMNQDTHAAVARFGRGNGTITLYGVDTAGNLTEKQVLETAGPARAMLRVSL